MSVSACHKVSVTQKVLERIRKISARARCSRERRCSILRYSILRCSTWRSHFAAAIAARADAAVHVAGGDRAGDRHCRHMHSHVLHKHEDLNVIGSLQAWLCLAGSVKL